MLTYWTAICQMLAGVSWRVEGGGTDWNNNSLYCLLITLRPSLVSAELWGGGRRYFLVEFYTARPRLISNWGFSWRTKIRSKLRSSFWNKEICFLIREFNWPLSPVRSSPIRTNQIQEIVTLYQYIHQNTNYTWSSSLQDQADPIEILKVNVKIYKEEY